MTSRAGQGQAGAGSRSPRRRARGRDLQNLDMGRARAAANRAVADVARPGSRTANASRGTRRTVAVSSGRRAGPGGTATRSPTRSATRAGTRSTGRAAAKPRNARQPAKPRAGRAQARRPGLADRAWHAPASAVRFVSTEPANRRRGLSDKTARIRSTRRLTMSSVVLVLGFGLIVSRLVDLQVLNPTAYGKKPQRIYDEELAAERGSITDRNGQPLALSVPGTSVFVDGTMTAEIGADPAREASLLAPLLEPDAAKVPARAADIHAKMADAERMFTYLARQVPKEVIDRITALKQQRDPTDPTGQRKNLASVSFLDEPRRFRPAGDVARSLIGDVNIDGDGQSGFERLFGEQLTGQPGRVTMERSAGGRTIAASEPVIEPAVRGHDLELTIDRSLQYETEQILTEQVRKAGAESGVAIVSVPSTGEILAMAGVDATRTGDAVTDVRVSSRNAAMIDTYEPGSVMKVVTTAAALEEEVVRPDTRLPVSERTRVCDQTFGEAEPSHALRGTASVAEIMEKSSNVGTIAIAQKLGRDPLYRYLKSFGFGERSPIGFPDEVSGTVPRPDHPDEWWCSSDGTVPIGQGIAVTPLQMLQAYNTIANGGVQVPARLVDATIAPDGTRTATPTDPGRRVVSARTAEQLNRMLRGVVTAGTGTAAAIPGYTPAGKTGTAKRAQAGGSYIGPDGTVHYDATFVGFVPAEAPALSVLVLIRDPASDIYAGTVAAPAFALIGAAALSHLGVAPPAGQGPAGAGGGTATVATSPGATASVERTGDGRVRVRAAGEPPATVVPALPTTTRRENAAVPTTAGARR